MLISYPNQSHSHNAHTAVCCYLTATSLLIHWSTVLVFLLNVKVGNGTGHPNLEVFTMKSCWILEDEMRNLSIYNLQTNLLSCRNTAILCKLCFTAPKQWKVIKPDEVHSVSWGRWCLQVVAEARKLIPLNFSQHWKKPIENRTNVVQQRKERLSLRNRKWWGRQRITGCTL